MHIARFYECVKCKFDKLTIGPCDLVSGEGTPRTLLLHLYYLFIYLFIFWQKKFLSFNMFLLQILLYCKGRAVQREGNKMSW